MAAEILPPYGIFLFFLWIVYNVNDIRKGQQQRIQNISLCAKGIKR